jgi:hypothetical protein
MALAALLLFLVKSLQFFIITYIRSKRLFSWGNMPTVGLLPQRKGVLPHAWGKKANFVYIHF